MKYLPAFVAFAFLISPLARPVRAASGLLAAPAQEAVNASNESQEPGAKSLLLKIFLASARLHDLLGLTTASNWKMTGAERTLFQQQVDSVQDELQTLEKWRYQFLYHPGDAQAGGKTLSSLESLIPKAGETGRLAGQYGGAAAAAQFGPALDALSALRNDLQAYLQTRFPAQFPKPAPAAHNVQAPALPPARASRASQTHPPPAVAPTIAPPAKPVTSEATQPVSVQPNQVKKALRGVFLTDARVSDLLSLLQPWKWKMQDTERALFNERVQTLQTQLKTAEKWRYQFLYNTKETKLGDSVVSALADLIPGIHGVGVTVAQYESPAAAAGFKRTAEELAGYKNSISSYVASLEAQYQKELTAQPAGMTGGKGLETERIGAPPPVAPPVRTLVVVTPPLTPAQVKGILHNIYISEFRVRDLLAQEHPERWKAPPAERVLAEQARALLLTRLSELEKWRQQFSQNPGNMYNAFQTYLAVNRLFHPLRVFGREAGKYESENMAVGYQRRADEMEAQMNGLVPYVGFILQHADEGVETFQSDLANCQNQLSYAMHRTVQRPVPMKNIVPVFQGRRTRKKVSKRADSPEK